MRIVTIVGARPQFIKAAPVSFALDNAGIHEFLVHTGQHYDYGMSQVFFDDLGIREADVNLGVGSGNHGWQTGQMLMGIEELLLKEKPDAVLVYGDTNSTLAGALAAVKLHIPVAHVEAGLRSFNRQMPEEHNRVLTDHCADLLFCPTQTAVTNLAQEGIVENVHLVGDTMYDAVLRFGAVARRNSQILGKIELEPKGYYLATVHRPYNTDVQENLAGILEAFASLDAPVAFPVHPRTRIKIEQLPIYLQAANICFIDPVGYLDMLMLEQNARMILTDSGGMQKEAYFFGIPCVTLRTETEWVETVEAGWNVVVGSSTGSILAGAQNITAPLRHPELFGDGASAEKIVMVLMECQ